MPTIFILARDWSLRAMVRAELRERGLDAQGMEIAAEAGNRIAAGVMPTVVVLEADTKLDPGLDSLARRVPFVVVASGMEGDVWPVNARKVLRRPIRIAEVVEAVLDLLRGQPA